MTRALMVRVEVQWMSPETYEGGPMVTARRVLTMRDLKEPHVRAGASYGALLMVRREIERAIAELMKTDAGLAKLRVLLEDEWQPKPAPEPAAVEIQKGDGA